MSARKLEANGGLHPPKHTMNAKIDPVRQYDLRG